MEKRSSDRQLLATDGPRAVILSGTAPGDPGVGGVILADLVQGAGPQRFTCAWLAPRAMTETPVVDGLETMRIERRYETAFRPVRGISGEIISACALRALRPAMLRECERQVRRLIDRVCPDFLLAVLESPAAIQVAARIRRGTGIPLRSIVWDDVELFCRQAYFDRWTRQRVLADFAYVLSESEQTGVICEAMQQVYERRYGISSIVIRHGLPTAAEPEESVRRADDQDSYVIGFAGSNTAPDALATFVRSMDHSNWRFEGRQIVLRLLGARYLLDSRRPQRIEYFGWRTVEDTRRLLAECDLLYLPQTFDESLRYFAELSFPTKLSTYVAAGRPILLHAPPYASLSKFWEQHDLGPYCRSLDGDELRRALRRGIEPDDVDASRWIAELAKVHQGVLSRAEFSRQVRHLVGLGAEDFQKTPVPVPASV